jgi:hypothetical protein
MTDSKSKDSEISPEMRSMVTKVKKGMRVTKITCSRTVRGKTGEEYVAFSTALDSIETPVAEDGAGVVEDGVQGITLKEAEVAAHLLGLQVDLVATEHARASGLISQGFATDAMAGIKTNYSELLKNILARSGSK